MLSRRRFTLLAPAVLGSALLGTACGDARLRGASAVDAGIPGAGAGPTGELVWGWKLPTTWDSAKGIGYDVHVLSLVYAGLTRIDPAGNLAPDLAHSWTYNAAGDAVTFHLREGLTYSDGTPVDAEAVKAGLERSRDLPGATSAQSLAIIRDITADSPLDVTLHLTQVSYQVPLLLAGLIGHLVSPTAIANGTDLALHPVGAGPFVLDEYVPGSHVRLRRNPTHWNAEAILLGTLRIVPKPAEAVTFAGLSSGQYDLAHVEESQIAALERAGFEIASGPCFNVHTLQINTRHAPFDDPRVVEAFNRAIDRQALVDGVLFGHGVPDWQPFTAGQPGYSAAVHEHWPFSPERARDLLAEAGHPDGIRVTFHVIGDPGSATSQKLAEAVQAQVKQAGFDLDLVIAPPGAGQRAAHSYTLHMYSFSGRESPVQALEVLYDEAGWMNIGEREPEGFDAALDLVRRTPLDDPAYPEVLQAATELAAGVGAGGAANAGGAGAGGGAAAGGAGGGGAHATPHAWLVNWHRAHAMNSRVRGFTHCLHTQRFEGVSVV